MQPTNSSKSPIPSDGDRSVLLKSCQSISLNLTQACAASSCKSGEQLILSYANALVAELKKPKVSNDTLIYLLLGMKRSITTAFMSSKITSLLSQIHSQTLTLFYIMKPYVFNDIEQDITQKSQSDFYNLILMETNPAAVCSVVLINYMEALSGDHSHHNKNQLLIAYIREHN